MAAARPLVCDGGIPAISAGSEVWVVIEKAAIGAVAGDPVAREHVLDELLRRRLSEPDPSDRR